MNIVSRACLTLTLIGGVELISEGKRNYICNILAVSKAGPL